MVHPQFGFGSRQGPGALPAQFGGLGLARGPMGSVAGTPMGYGYPIGGPAQDHMLSAYMGGWQQRQTSPGYGMNPMWGHWDFR